MLKRLVAIVAAIVILVFAIVWFSGKHADVKLSQPVAAVGISTPVAVQVTDPHGLKSFAASIEQNGQAQTVFQDKRKSRQVQRSFAFTVGKKEAQFLNEGPAKLVFRASSNDFRGATTTVSQDVQVNLRPPTIVADGRQHYINQGGSELVLLDVGGNWTDAGVRTGYATAGTFAMPGEPDESNHRFSLFPFPWDIPPDTIPVAFARNAAGTEVTTTFWVKLFPKKFRSSKIEVNDRELQKVLGELDQRVVAA